MSRSGDHLTCLRPWALSAPNLSAGAPGFTGALLLLMNRSIRASGPFGVLKALGLKRFKPPRHFRPISSSPLYTPLFTGGIEFGTSNLVRLKHAKWWFVALKSLRLKHAKSYPAHPKSWSGYRSACLSLCQVSGSKRQPDRESGWAGYRRPGIWMGWIPFGVLKSHRLKRFKPPRARRGLERLSL